MTASLEADVDTAEPAGTKAAPEKNLIVRLGAMGDIVHTLPAVATLRQRFPDSQIDWVVEERWAELLCSRPELRHAPRSPQKPLVDNVHVVDTRAWRKSLLAAATRREFMATVSKLRDIGYDCALDLQGSVKSSVLARLSRARTRVGFSRPRETPASLFYTRRVAAQGNHIVEQNVSLADSYPTSAGEGQTQGTHVLEFPLPVDAQMESWAEREVAQRGLGEFVLLNPGAGWGAKCWPPERMAAVARSLADDGLQALVNHGPGEEALARAVIDASAGSAQAFSGSIGELIAIARRARLCVGGDTGPTHLAAALGVPVVGIYGPTDPARNGPYGSPSRILRSEKSVTSHARRAETEAGLLEITAESVVEAARKLLREVARG